jgi:predicted Zn finger-like uncharacterized protein
MSFGQNDPPRGLTAQNVAGGGTAPMSCPTCRSSSITSAAKIPNADSYWRCEKCGDIWNGARTQRPSYGRMSR